MPHANRGNLPEGSLSSKAGQLDAAAGDTILREGETGREMYIVEQGRVEVVSGPPGSERQLGVLEAGDFFGEMAILDDQPRGATVRALTACRFLRIDEATFDRMLREYPEIAVRMLRKLSARLRQASANPEIVRPPSAELPAPVSKPDSPAASSPPAPLAAATTSPAPEAPAAASAPPGVSAPAPSDVGGVLVAVQSGMRFVLPSTDEIKVGRFDAVTGVHPDVDLTSVDTNKLTSRRHARLVRDRGKFLLNEEIGTPNGTFVNETRLQTGVPVALSPGDRVRFGDVEMIFQAG
ncbi:MAG: cyclic nucleotide-binding domain-containing protein [Acidobacteria bacterium]|nr:cyclic nucleotide-binding domain-containing protein [Acidobacteriota bacterium]MCA1610173.1 cyclic nucleotide-binding domain-containing protein [Acidobacteriota bacterium]MCA1617238.1 cyclic nucleotide-binding domain-containing protein [Acidobacteriota bacterium]